MREIDDEVIATVAQAQQTADEALRSLRAAEAFLGVLDENNPVIEAERFFLAVHENQGRPGESRIEPDHHHRKRSS